MSYALEPFHDVGLNETLLKCLIEEHEAVAVPEYERLWAYYRNPHVGSATSKTGPCSHRLAQASGLPDRLLHPHSESTTREIVIENDIAWRIETMQDYFLSGGVQFLSKAEDPELRSFIETLLQTVIEANGGSLLIHKLGLLGSIYGHVDLILRTDAFIDAVSNIPTHHKKQSGTPEDIPSDTSTILLRRRELLRLARILRTEMVEAPRAIPILDPSDYSNVLAYIIRYQRVENTVRRVGFLEKLTHTIGRELVGSTSERLVIPVTEIFSATHHQVYDNETLVFEEHNPLGIMPLVHIQNLSQPYYYEGLSDVEPLIALQDELNTRLSDRANRVTLQSFKMYLGKGIEGFGERPVSPGQMWMTDNTDASIIPFGGDSDCPSEEQHIHDIRDALDKASSVTPLAAGLIRAKVGTLSSENALRISLLGILSKTERKRQLHSMGLRRLADLILHAFETAGVFCLSPEDRRVDVIWGTPLPLDESKQLENAVIKRDLGVPLDRLLAELGYDQESS